MTLAEQILLILADLILLIHAGFVGCVVLGLLLIWIGWLRQWSFVRNVWFRIAHLAAIGIVVAESVAGFVCPLTTWENRLRLLAGSDERYQGSFVQHWLHRIMFFDLNERVFTIIYLAFFLAVALSLWVIPPTWRCRSRGMPAKPDVEKDA